MKTFKEVVQDSPKAAGFKTPDNVRYLHSKKNLSPEMFKQIQIFLKNSKGISPGLIQAGVDAIIHALKNKETK